MSIGLWVRRGRSCLFCSRLLVCLLDCVYGLVCFFFWLACLIACFLSCLLPCLLACLLACFFFFFFFCWFVRFASLCWFAPGIYGADRLRQQAVHVSPEEVLRCPAQAGPEPGRVPPREMFRRLLPRRFDRDQEVSAFFSWFCVCFLDPFGT